MDFKMVFTEKIGPLYIYNFDVHQIYIIWWHHSEKYIWIDFPIHFPYILTLTSPSPSVSDGMVHFELTVTTAKVLSSMRPFIWYTYWGWSRGCLQLHRQQFRWRWYQKTDFGFGLRGPDYPRDDRERSKIWLWIIKPN